MTKPKDKPENNYKKYQAKKYQRLAVEKGTHKRIVHHAKKENKLIKDYIDSIVPEI